MWHRMVMAAPGRPSIITPELAQEIRALDAQGLTLDGIVRALAGRGRPVSRRTLGRFFERHGHVERPATASAGSPPGLGSPAAPSALTTTAAGALEGDDVASIARCAADVRRALAEWAPAIGVDPSAQRAYASLARLNADLSARLVELRPKPEVEADRLSALDADARAALISRARAAALADYAGKYHRAREVLRAKGWL